MGVCAHMQTDQASARGAHYHFPNVVRAHVRAGRLFVYKSVVVDDNDEVMVPVWQLCAGLLTLCYSELFPDDTILFGEAIGRVFKID